MTLDRAYLNEMLNAADQTTRLANLRELYEDNYGGVRDVELTEEVNNHVHTIYSFSPYSPTYAAFMARMAGLAAVGSVDHDSIAGASEMIDAGKVLDLGTTVGCELRVNFNGTAVEGRRLNNPDSVNIAYMVLHGVPSPKIKETAYFLVPIHEARNRRNRAQVERINEIVKPLSIPSLDFEEDVVSASQAHEGGSITERHILYALARKIMEMEQPGPALVKFVRENLEVEIPAKVADYLSDPENPHYVYDLLGVMKSSFLPRFFIQPNEEECISVFEVVDFANSIGALPSYAYLGDITESPTGDKKAAKFEDGLLDELMPELKRIGYRSVTYMPPRNTVDQLRRVQMLCTEHGLMEISGVDINSSRQSFRCPEVMQPEFRHLFESTWALIAHEKLASCNENYGLFAGDNPYGALPLPQRIKAYSAIGQQIDRTRPEKACELVDSGHAL